MGETFSSHLRTCLQVLDCDVCDCACLNQIKVCGLIKVWEIQAGIVSEDMTFI